MRRTTKRQATSAAAVEGTLAQRVRAAIGWLEQHSSARTRKEMPRYGLPSDHALGVPMKTIQQLATRLGHDHDLALALWASGVYEARLLACYVAEPARLTPARMDRWCRDFDNWGICDTACFVLFDRTPHALTKVTQWSRRRDEFGKRAAFALLACIALHDKGATDATLARCLPLAEAAAQDDRNFVKKGVSWALRAVGGRSPALEVTVLALSRRLADSSDSAPRWVGKDVLRQLLKSRRARGTA